MKMKKRDGIWYVHFKNRKGERKRLSCETGDEQKATTKALEIVAEHAGETADAGNGVVVVGSGGVSMHFLLARCYDEVWSKQKSAKSMEYRVEILKQDIGHWPVAQTTYTKLDTYRTKKLAEERGLEASTCNRYMQAVGKALTKAVHWGYLTARPLVPLMAEDNIVERYMSEEEEAKAEAELTRRAGTAPYVNASWAYMLHVFRLLMDTGLRRGEALGLTPANNLGNRVWLKHGTTKSNKARTIPLTERAKASLEAMLASPVHGNIGPNRITQKWMEVRDYLGMPDVKLHTVRHTTASRLIQDEDADMDIYRVQKWLGHANQKTTERYAHLRPGFLDRGVKALEKGDAKVAVDFSSVEMRVLAALMADAPKGATEEELKAHVMRAAGALVPPVAEPVTPVPVRRHLRAVK